MEGQMKIFHVGSHQLRESLREWLRKLWFSYCTSRETPFREWNSAFRESVSELREMLREYPGTLPELREWPFRSESVFPEIGVVPRLLAILEDLYALFAPELNTRSCMEEFCARRPLDWLRLATGPPLSACCFRQLAWLQHVPARPPPNMDQQVRNVGA